MSSYHLLQGEKSVRVVDSPGPHRGSNSLPSIFALAKYRAGWKEGGAGLQMVDGALEAKILDAFAAMGALG